MNTTILLKCLRYLYTHQIMHNVPSVYAKGLESLYKKDQFGRQACKNLYGLLNPKPAPEFRNYIKLNSCKDSINIPRLHY